MEGRKQRRWLKRAPVAVLVLVLAHELGMWLTPMPAGLVGEVGEVAIELSTEIVDREGRGLRMLLVDDARYSRWCGLEAVSETVVAATVAAEDKRFWEHGGVDYLAVGRAVRDGVGAGRLKSGASTISQQVVKLARPVERTLGQKVAEMWLARRVEREWGKERILEQYLNRLDYGGLRVGIGAASWGYFGKPASDLSPAEAAYLAGLPVAPGRLSPQRNPEGAKERQAWVLGRMLANGFLDQDGYARALVEPLEPRVAGMEFEAPHFVDLMLRRRGVVDGGGGVVRTTLDLELNRFVERTLTENLADLREKNVTGGAVVVIENATGEVLALAGSADYFEAGTGQVNGAWAVRSPGSAMKPFAYLLALEGGAEPCTVVADVPSEFPTPTGIYRPNNYNHRFYGPVSLRSALGNSLNVGAVRTLQMAGGPEVLHRRMRELGVTTFGHPAEYYGLGLVLGNGEVRLLELANAYAALARLGEFRPFKLLRDGGGDGGGVRRVCDVKAAYLVADMLADNGARAGSFGLNSYLHFDYPVACKTGTSSNYRDNWTMAYTPEFTVGVWVGNANGSPMREVTGATGAAPVMWRVMEHLHVTRGTGWFERPEGIGEFEIDPLTGRLAMEGSERSVRALCAKRPGEAREGDYDDVGRVRLGEQYEEWLKGGQNGLAGLVVGGGSRSGELRIARPVAGSLYYLDGDLPADSQWVALCVEGERGEVEWGCETLEMAGEGKVKLREGRHEIVARDVATGSEARTWIEVERW